MKNISQAIQYLYPNIKINFLTDVIINDDGKGGETITYWNTALLGKQPTDQQIQDAARIATFNNNINDSVVPVPAPKFTFGTGILFGGTLMIFNTAVTANTLVFITNTASGDLKNMGNLVANVQENKGFNVTSTNPLDTSTFNYLLINY